MARKITNITHSASQYDILSQTPKNYDQDNYWIDQLQHKVNTDWNYRPNRVDIEFETLWGQSQWEPIEVVIQSVKSEKGNIISDDYRKIVFKNILEDRFKIGSRFRFSPSYILGEDEYKKNTWIAINTNTVKMTSAMVIQRCNGILGSVYKDTRGVSHYHYEPVIQEGTLSSTNFSYTDTSVTPGASLMITAQYNEFTKKYKTNQRFIIGARESDPLNPGHFIGGQVYRVTAINTFYGNSTNDSENVGLIKIYMEITEGSPYDKWDEKIAYQNSDETYVSLDDKGKEYSIIFKLPEVMPNSLSENGITFIPMVVSNGEIECPEISQHVTMSINLENWPSTKSIEDQARYVSLESILGDDGLNSFIIKRNRIYTIGKLSVTCKVDAEYSPNGLEINTAFLLNVDGRE